MKELSVGKNDAGQRLDKFITKTLNLPTALLYKSIRTKKIKVNRKRAEIGQKLEVGDTVQCFLKDEFFKNKSGSADELMRITPSLDIIYEDENIILVNKRPGISVHEDETGSRDTLIVHLLAYLAKSGEYSPEDEQSFAPALCNRIDRNTGGIVIAAKSAEALRVMNEKIKLREIDKFYLAAVHGHPTPESATITAYLLKDSKENIVRIYDKNPPKDAKRIITKYAVVAKSADTSLIEVELLTGRTHQIRAHMAHIGHPLVGDGKYGVNRADRARGYKYQALASYKLRFAFKTDAGILNYLKDKEFSIPKDKIYFTKEYFAK
ncbi:MAG: RluA family pseudouridine synthase [Clostridia bacterium]|nr:RluA family pseudouridine synthase [Clostridia bacterium]